MIFFFCGGGPPETPSRTRILKLTKIKALATEPSQDSSGDLRLQNCQAIACELRNRQLLRVS